MIEDLRRFRASPEVPRLAVALIAAAAVMLFALASTSLPNPDNAAPQVASDAYLVAPEGGELPAAAAPLGKCQHLVRGQWLYWSIEHKGDRVEYHHCEYANGWRGVL